MNHWIGDSAESWCNESMNQWINESILLEAASYCGYFFSDCALSCLPASSSVASATQFFSSCSCYIAFSNRQLQSRIAEASHASLMLCCAQPCQCDLSQPVANPHGRSVATNQPKFAQRQPCGLDHTNPELLRTSQFFALLRGNQALATVWKCKPSSCYSLIHISPTWSSKSAPNFRTLYFCLHFEEQIELSLESCAPLVDNFARSTRGTAETETATPGATSPEKTQRRKTNLFSLVSSHAPELLHFPTTWWWVVDMMMWLTWWCEC